MNKEFIPYEQASALKELGFDEKCLAYYKYDKELYQEKGVCYVNSDFGETMVWDEMLPNKNCTAPLYQQAFRWFREKYKIGTWIHHYFNIDKGTFEYSWVITLPYKDDGYVYDTYEEAELACLNKLIEIVKEVTNEQKADKH